MANRLVIFVLGLGLSGCLQHDEPHAKTAAEQIERARSLISREYRECVYKYREGSPVPQAAAQTALCAKNLAESRYEGGGEPTVLFRCSTPDTIGEFAVVFAPGAGQENYDIYCSLRPREGFRAGEIGSIVGPVSSTYTK